MIAREEALKAQSSSAAVASNVALDEDLLPPNAVPGECYARVWIDAEYETVSESVLVNAVSSRLETIPAVYGTETKTIKIRNEKRM